MKKNFKLNILYPNINREIVIILKYLYNLFFFSFLFMSINVFTAIYVAYKVFYVLSSIKNISFYYSYTI